jgi:hypothetical protein
MRRPLVAVACALAGALAAVSFSAAASAQTSSTSTTTASGVQITPSLVQRDLPNHDLVQRVTVTNNTNGPRQITITVSGLGHDLDGTPQFVEPASVADNLHVDATSFVLQPGNSRDLTVTAHIPASPPSLYAAVIAEFAVPGQAAGGAVESHTRVVTLLLLRAPKPWTQTAQVADVGATPGGNGQPATVFATVRDTGNVHIRPSGTARISQNGTTLATVDLPAANILPGFARRLSGTWTPPPNLTGTVQIDVTIHDPDATGSGTVTFTKGVAQVPGGKIVQVRPQPGPRIVTTVQNSGTAPLRPVLTVTASEGSNERDRKVIVATTDLAPGATADYTWEPQLPNGLYTIKAELRQGDSLLDQQATGLRVGPDPSTTRTHSSTKNKTGVAAAAVVALLLAAGAITFAVRRRRGSGGEKAGLL